MSTSSNDTAHAAIEAIQRQRAADENRYTMRISRRTVDKLGVKLYDRASAVVAELVANAYDADAERVHVRLPLSTLLGNRPDQKRMAETTPSKGEEELAEIETEGAPDSLSLSLDLDIDPDEEQNVTPAQEAPNGDDVIEVIDDGHGMDPDEADHNFLTVGQDRRTSPTQGARSRNKGRPVMGRKGIGKLAPFGICTRIEVISAGGKRTGAGYLTSHFVLDYDEIVQDTEKPYHPDRGPNDRTHSAKSGTTIRLSRFQRKRVPDQETFKRQLARRFGAPKSDFEILIEDLRGATNNQSVVTSLDIPVVETTRIKLDARPVPTDQGLTLPVTGWIGMAQQGYKHEELAGVRIYARNKIVATTRDFGLMSGFTGENTLRSYLVGEIHAEWLDEDIGEDLIKTDRQDILWESDRGQALRSWGHDLLREIGALTRKPRRESVRKRFLKVARLRERANDLYTDQTVVTSALELADMIGGFAAEDELEDTEYVDGLCDVILSVAPHRALMEAFRAFKEQVDPNGSTLESLLDLFDKTRVAELASYSQIAMERVNTIEKLSAVVHTGAPERALQQIISRGPWLIDPTWSVLTANQSLATFAEQFEAIWREEHKEEITIDIGHGRKRPDFTAMEVGGRLRVVEIKAPKHKFDSEDFLRLQNYVQALRDLFRENKEIGKSFPGGWRIDLVVDGVKIDNITQSEAFSSFQDKSEVVQSTWRDFIARAQRANSAFLAVRRESNLMFKDTKDASPLSDGNS